MLKENNYNKFVAVFVLFLINLILIIGLVSAAEWYSGELHVYTGFRGEIGYVAQEVQEVFPEMVVPMSKENEKDEQMFGVESNTQLTLVLLQTAKELTEIVEELKAENNLLKEDLCSLGITRWC